MLSKMLAIFLRLLGVEVYGCLFHDSLFIESSGLIGGISPSLAKLLLEIGKYIAKCRLTSPQI